MKNKYPIYIPTKGRAESRKTIKALQRMGTDFRIVIEENQYNDYLPFVDIDQILILPFNKPGDHSMLVATRNWIKEHSIKEGHKRHWQLDDNIKAFYRLNNGIRVEVLSPVIFRVVEDFVDRYTNIGMAGLNYMNYAIPDGRPPFILNSRVYSMSLVNNELPYKWRGIYNDDTDICLRILKDGYCTVNFNAFSGDKDATMVTKGGNTPIYTQGDQRENFVDSLVEQHPDVAKKVWRYNRWHHDVNYSGFKKNKLIRTSDYNYQKKINNYGMEMHKREYYEHIKNNISENGLPF